MVCVHFGLPYITKYCPILPAIHPPAVNPPASHPSTSHPPASHPPSLNLLPSQCLWKPWWNPCAVSSTWGHRVLLWDLLLLEACFLTSQTALWYVTICSSEESCWNVKLPETHCDIWYAYLTLWSVHIIHYLSKIDGFFLTETSSLHFVSFFWWCAQVKVSAVSVLCTCLCSMSETNSLLCSIVAPLWLGSSGLWGQSLLKCYCLTCLSVNMSHNMVLLFCCFMTDFYFVCLVDLWNMLTS